VILTSASHHTIGISTLLERHAFSLVYQVTVACLDNSDHSNNQERTSIHSSSFLFRYRRPGARHIPELVCPPRWLGMRAFQKELDFHHALYFYHSLDQIRFHSLPPRTCILPFFEYTCTQLMLLLSPSSSRSNRDNDAIGYASPQVYRHWPGGGAWSPVKTVH
jgi:hypothetical protein